MKKNCTLPKHNISKYRNECLSVFYAWTDFDEFFYVYLSGFLGDLDSQLNPVGPTRGSA